MRRRIAAGARSLSPQLHHLKSKPLPMCFQSRLQELLRHLAQEQVVQHSLDQLRLPLPLLPLQPPLSLLVPVHDGLRPLHLLLSDALHPLRLGLQALAGGRAAH